MTVDSGTAGSGDARSTRLVGSHDLQGRAALQVTVRDQWCYVGHLPGTQPNDLTGEVEHNGTSIVDVSEPSAPRLVAHIAGDSPRGNSRAVQVIVSEHDGRDYLIRNNESPGACCFEVFDICDRSRPSLVTRITETPRGPITYAHKGWWDQASGLYFACAGEAGFRWGGHLVIWDLSNPADPRFVARHWLPGQEESEPHPGGAKGINLHHPVVDIEAGKIYQGYPQGGFVEVVDIEDVSHPTTEMLFCIAPTFNRGPHTALPLKQVPCPNFTDGVGDVRDFIVFANEANNGRPGHTEIRTMVYMLDVTAPSNPMTVDTFRVPDAEYVPQGGRFGPHQFAETQDGSLYSPKDNGNLLHVAYFSAGLRILDITDPYDMKEVGHYVPAVTDRTVTRPGSLSEPIEQKVIQTNDVDLDARGLAYVSDRAGTGLHVIEYQGAAA
jgi:hypothetical protein